MGRWTPNYTDNVLNSKISALITGAINRAAVEKEPTITYEEFVKELDTGDAFTTSLMDILVKELAERHNRPFQNDERRLIAVRTAERLKSLANPRQIYRERPSSRNHTGRRTYNLAEFMSLPMGDMDEEDNDFEIPVDGTSGAAEGARFNTDLFEAYGAHTWSPIARRLGTTPSPPLEDEPPLWRSHGALSTLGRGVPRTNPVHPTSSVPATSLTRHSSIRRPMRSRMVDFHDWTSRRRSAVRDSFGAQGENPEDNSSLSFGNGGETSQTVRRFFPTRPLERRSEPRDDRSGGEDGRSIFSMEPEWSPAHTLSSANATVMDTDHPLPRLRRGGIRPPETFYAQRFPWSAPSSWSRSTTDLADEVRIVRSPSPAPVQPTALPSPSPPREDAGTVASSTEPVGYPTPGSVENEPASV